MKKIFVVTITTCLLISCASERETMLNNRGHKYSDNYILLYDAAGRCLQVETDFNTSGTSSGQYGRLRIRVLENIDCVLPSEQK